MNPNNKGSPIEHDPFGSLYSNKENPLLVWLSKSQNLDWPKLKSAIEIVEHGGEFLKYKFKTNLVSKACTKLILYAAISMHEANSLCEAISMREAKPLCEANQPRTQKMKRQAI